MTARELADRMKARSRAVEPEFRRTTNTLAVRALRFCRERLTAEIYSQPVPKRPKSGKPEWRRTGNLRRSERLDVRDAYTAAIVNDASYALPRHEAGKPDHRPTRYPAHWRDELREAFRSVTQTAYRETVKKILEKRL